MTAPFRGVVNLDVRDSVPDWAPNVLCIVLDEWTVRRFELLRRDCRHPRRYCRGSRPGGLRDNQWHPTGTRPRCVSPTPRVTWWPRVAWW